MRFLWNFHKHMFWNDSKLIKKMVLVNFDFFQKMSFCNHRLVVLQQHDGMSICMFIDALKPVLFCTIFCKLCRWFCSLSKTSRRWSFKWWCASRFHETRVTFFGRFQNFWVPHFFDDDMDDSDEWRVSWVTHGWLRFSMLFGFGWLQIHLGTI